MLVGYFNELNLSNSAKTWIMFSWVFVVGAIQVATNWKSSQEIKELKSDKLR